MLIATTVLRDGGSRHEISGVIYHFVPGDDPARHHAQVDDADHIARFLSIDGFEPAEAVAFEADEVPEGSDGVGLDDMNREQLADVYAQVFGRAPHWRLGEDVMRERIRSGSED